MVRGLAFGLTFVIPLLGGIARADTCVAPPPEGRGVTGTSTPGIIYKVSSAADGGIQFSGEAPDLQFQKTSYADGHFTLRIVSHGDTLELNAGMSGIEVTRGNRSQMLEASGITAQDAAKMRALFAGSRALRRYRELAAALQRAGDTSPAAHGVLVPAALLEQLDGDASAPARIARGLAGAKAAVRLRPIRRSDDCWDSYASRTYAAAVDYCSCYNEMSGSSFFQDLCAFTWVLRCESYWFQFLSCSAIPLRMQ